MSTQESSYAPKSPDLSSFYSSTTSDIPQATNTASGYPFQAGLGVGAGPNTPLRYNQPQPHHSQYRPLSLPSAQPTSAPAFGNNSNTAFNTFLHQGGGSSGPYEEQYEQYNRSQQGTQLIHHNQPPYTLQAPTAPTSFQSSFPESIPIPYQTQLHAQAQAEAQKRALAQSQPFPPKPRSPPSNEQVSLSGPQKAMPPRKIAPAAKQDEVEPSPVKTKFPTARIKRIMQADEEVGKVAQQTPIAVGKALELFMVQLVRKSAEVAKERSSKRITAPMLKQAIDSANEWDFLQDIVAKVGEEKEGGKSSGRPKAESDSDEEADVGEVKKKSRGGRKKKVPA